MLFRTKYHISFTTPQEMIECSKLKDESNLTVLFNSLLICQSKIYCDSKSIFKLGIFKKDLKKVHVARVYSFFLYIQSAIML